MYRILFGAVLGWSLGVAQAATFNVANLNDSGAGSLRDAIAQANANPGADTVTFGVTGTILLTSGQIRISDALTIAGPGATSLTIDANANGRVFVVNVTSPVCPAPDGPDYHVTISGVRLVNARYTDANTGGAILSQKSLTLDSVVIEGNKASQGAGLGIFTENPGQTLTIRNSEFKNNLVQPLTSSTVAQGGAIYVVNRCGGAVAPVTPIAITIDNSVFSGNRSQPTTGNGRGGAIMSGALPDIVITDTRITGNAVDIPNPPVDGQQYRGAGFYGTFRSLWMERSEVSDNTISPERIGDDFARGAGMALLNSFSDLQGLGSASTVNIINSTISGNVSSASAAAVFLVGNVTFDVENSTIANNTAAPTRSGGIGQSNGTGGVLATPAITLVSSIVYNNPGTNLDIGGSATIPTCVIGAANSLIGTIDPQCSVAGSGNLIGVDPMLGPLAFNGGDTRTHEVMPGSPAIATGSNPLTLGMDQRGFGFPRMFNGMTDMGAFQSTAGSLYSRNYVQKSYVAYYGRPADPPGQGYWAKRMDDEGQSLASIIAAFGNSEEFNRRYGGLTAAQLITKLYQQALARDPDQGGLDYYVGELIAGNRTLQTITLDVLNGATTAPDSTVVANKLAVADFYTAYVALGCPYGSEQDGVDSIAGVTADPATVIAAMAAIENRCSS